MFSGLTSALLIDITITLTFLRSMTNRDAIQRNAAFNRSTDSLTGVEAPSTLLGKQKIDPHSPLVLHSSKLFHTLFAAMHNPLQRQSVTRFGPAFCPSHPKYQRKYHHLFPPNPQSTHHYRSFLT